MYGSVWHAWGDGHAYGAFDAWHTHHSHFAGPFSVHSCCASCNRLYFLSRQSSPVPSTGMLAPYVTPPVPARAVSMLTIVPALNGEAGVGFRALWICQCRGMPPSHRGRAAI